LVIDTISSIYNTIALDIRLIWKRSTLFSFYTANILTYYVVPST